MNTRLLRLAGTVFPRQEQRYDERDAILYALGLGLGMEPTDRAQLPYVYEDAPGGLRVLPTFAVTLAYPGHWIRNADLGLDWARAVHVHQALTLHRQLPAAARVLASTRVDAVIDKGKTRGALLCSSRTITCAETGAPLADVRVTTLARGDGGRGGGGTVAARPHPLPARAPDAQMDFPTSRQGSLIYRLCADRNPLHADPDVAARAGYARPIAHGLWTYGIAGFCVIQLAGSGDASRLVSLECRFSAPAYAGDTIRFACWVDGPVVSFSASVPERAVTVLDNGRAQIRPADSVG